MMKVRLTRGIFIDGQPFKAGDIVEVSVRDGRYFIGMKKAEEVKDAGSKPMKAEK